MADAKGVGGGLSSVANVAKIIGYVAIVAACLVYILAQQAKPEGPVPNLKVLQFNNLGRIAALNTGNRDLYVSHAVLRAPSVKNATRINMNQRVAAGGVLDITSRPPAALAFARKSEAVEGQPVVIGYFSPGDPQFRLAQGQLGNDLYTVDCSIEIFFYTLPEGAEGKASIPCAGAVLRRQAAAQPEAEGDAG